MTRSLWAALTPAPRIPVLGSHVRCLAEVCAMGGGVEAYRRHLACADVFPRAPRCESRRVEHPGSRRSSSFRSEDSTKLSCRDLMWRWQEASR